MRKNKFNIWTIAWSLFMRYQISWCKWPINSRDINDHSQQGQDAKFKKRKKKDFYQLFHCLEMKNPSKFKVVLQCDLQIVEENRKFKEIRGFDMEIAMFEIYNYNLCKSLLRLKTLYYNNQNKRTYTVCVIFDSEKNWNRL